MNKHQSMMVVYSRLRGELSQPTTLGVKGHSVTWKLQAIIVKRSDKNAQILRALQYILIFKSFFMKIFTDFTKHM